MLTASPSPQRAAVLANRIRLIVAGTIAYNVVEAIVALTAGAAASSAALVRFGLDSVIEVLSAAAVAWQFASPTPQQRERAALRIVTVSFFGLALFVGFDAIRSLLGFSNPERSVAGIILALVSVLVMPGASWLEQRTGRELGSASAVADSKQTLICSYLSAAVLIGLLLNAWLGWTWADSAAALVVVVFAAREGLEAWRGDACKQPVAALVDQNSTNHHC